MKRSRGLVVAIGVGKLLKTIALVAIAIGVISLSRGDPHETARGWLIALDLDPHRGVMQHLLGRLDGIDHRHLKLYAAGSLAYAAVFGTEGVGLLSGKRWAEWFTVIVTGSFLPIECYELARHPSIAKVIVLVLNAAIVVYLAHRRLSEAREQRHERASHV